MEAQYNLGLMYSKGKNTKKDDKQAFFWFQKAAEQGSSEAQVILGIIYREKQNYKQALHWLQKAAEQDQAKAQLTLGIMYAQGEGVTKNNKQAKEWFKKACDNNLKNACTAYNSLK